MKGDYSRFTFDPTKHYTAVRMQQGRVQLDADWNEQVDILLHLVRAQLEDIIGSGAPAWPAPGFAITLDETVEARADSLPDFRIGPGRCYVQGVLCENEAPALFSRQPDYPGAAALLRKEAKHDQYLVYLDVFPRHITVLEDPAIRETALGGADTGTRVKTTWQVRLLPIHGSAEENLRAGEEGGLRGLTDWRELEAWAASKRRLQARLDPPYGQGRQVENRLYRVEIHADTGSQVEFKWSRENGAVALPITLIEPVQQEPAPDPETPLAFLRVVVENLGRDPNQLGQDSWVEIADDVTLLDGRPLPLCQVASVEPSNGHILLKASPERIHQILREDICSRTARQHPLLRRWEGDAQAAFRGRKTKEKDAPEWLDVENGIQVSFSKTGGCLPGDYWLIPARTRSASGIEWPAEDGRPLPRLPHGVPHAYAPLALLAYRKQEGRWAVCPGEPAGFDPLPRVKTSLAGINEQLLDVFARLNRIQGTLEGLTQKTHLIETVKSAEPLECGDVVALDREAVEPVGRRDPDGELQVVLAESTQPELLLGVVRASNEAQGEERRCQVVLHGRARCKVIGRVEPGDLLVISDRFGRARKAGRNPPPGTALGRALGFTRFASEVMEEIEEGKRKIDAGLDDEPGEVDALILLA